MGKVASPVALLTAPIPASPYWALFIGNLALSIMVYVLKPEYVYLLIEEGMLIQIITPSLFFITFALAAVLLLQKRHKWVFLFISSLSLLLFLEEIDYGKSLLGFNLPEFWGKESNAHDIAKTLLLHVLQSSLKKYVLLVVCSLITIIVFLFWKRWGNLSKIFYDNQAYVLILTALVLIVASFIIDMHLMRSEFLDVIEENFEMNAALALLFASVSLNSQN